MTKNIATNRNSVSKIKAGLPLHKHIAAGGSSATYSGSKGINNKTIPCKTRCKN